MDCNRDQAHHHHRSKEGFEMAPATRMASLDGPRKI